MHGFQLYLFLKTMLVHVTWSPCGSSLDYPNIGVFSLLICNFVLSWANSRWPPSTELIQPLLNSLLIVLLISLILRVGLTHVGVLLAGFTGCLVIGLAALVDFVLALPESDYYLKGAGKRIHDPALTQMVVVIALTARVSEVPLAMVLADDRLPSRLSAIDAAVVAERDALLSISSGAALLLADLCNLSRADLIGQAEKSVAVQIGYAEMRVRSARLLPWSLIGGNVEKRFCIFTLWWQS